MHQNQQAVFASIWRLDTAVQITLQTQADQVTKQTVLDHTIENQRLQLGALKDYEHLDKTNENSEFENYRKEVLESIDKTSELDPDSSDFYQSQINKNHRTLTK